MQSEKTEKAANEVAIALFETERAIEAALDNTAKTLSALAGLKSAAGLSVFHGQEIVEQASDLIHTLAQGRRQAGELHRLLEEARAEIGIKPIAFGPVGKPSLRSDHGQAKRERLQAV